MRDLYNLHKFYNVETNGKSSKQLNNRRKSFGYQVLGFGSGVVAEVVIDPNQKGMFGYGEGTVAIPWVLSVTNLVSNAGVVALPPKAPGQYSLPSRISWDN